MATPVAMEPLLGYHPCSIGFLTSSREPAGGQCQVGEFDWGGWPPKGYRRRSKVPQNGWKPLRKSKGRRELDCDTDGWSRYESRLVIRWYKVGLPSLNG